jgi:hypothetical protein
MAGGDELPGAWMRQPGEAVMHAAARIPRISGDVACFARHACLEGMQKRRW